MKYPIEISYTLDNSKHRITITEQTGRSWTFDVEDLDYTPHGSDPDKQEAHDIAQQLLSRLTTQTRMCGFSFIHNFSITLE